MCGGHLCAGAAGRIYGMAQVACAAERRPLVRRCAGHLCCGAQAACAAAFLSKGFLLKGGVNALLVPVTIFAGNRG